MEVTFRYESRSPGRPRKAKTVRTKMRYFFRYELEHLLARSGFTEVRSSAASTAAPSTHFSGETVVLARA